MSSGVEYVIVDGVAYPKAGTFGARGDSGDGPAAFPAPRRVPAFSPAAFPAACRPLPGAGGHSPVTSFDAHRVHREFPARWAAFIRANFHDLRHVQQVFGVSERTARTWWRGETGAGGGYVAIAVAVRPVAAQRMLFAAE